jgi:hypothetical protein
VVGGSGTKGPKYRSVLLQALCFGQLYKVFRIRPDPVKEIHSTIGLHFPMKWQQRNLEIQSSSSCIRRGRNPAAFGAFCICILLFVGAENLGTLEIESYPQLLASVEPVLCF